MELQWPLILFTTFLAWSAGLFATQSVYSLKGVGAKAQMRALIASVVILIASGIAVFTHLEHWERIFNGFGHITSGITQELIAIVVMFLCMVVYFVYLRRTGDEAKVPKWLAIVSAVVAIVLICVAGHSYMMPSRPTWDSVFQVASLVGGAAAMGAATMAFFCATADDAADLNGKANLLGHGLNVVLVIAFVAAMVLAGSAFTQVGYWFDPTSPTLEIAGATESSPFASGTMPYTIGAIACAVVGLVCAFIGKKTGKWQIWGIIALIFALASAICLRVVFYVTGITVYPFY